MDRELSGTTRERAGKNRDVGLVPGVPHPHAPLSKPAFGQHAEWTRVIVEVPHPEALYQSPRLGVWAARRVD